jgi:hypothetical protein
LLFGLKYVKEGQLSFCRLNVNRIPSLRLLVALCEKVKATDKQLCYMLEELCLQTLPALIERVYVSRLAELSAAEGSQIIKKYAHAREISYNVKGSEESLKLTAREVELQLERLKASPQQEITAIAAKYVVQVIFQTSLLYEYGDRALWSLILAAHSPPQRPSSDLQAEIE